MRPESLFPLFKPVTSLPGVGPRITKLVEKAAGPHVVDLCWHLPSAIIDRRYAPRVEIAGNESIRTQNAKITAAQTLTRAAAGS